MNPPAALIAAAGIGCAAVLAPAFLAAARHRGWERRQADFAGGAFA